LGCAAFLASVAVHYLGYQRYLTTRLRDPEVGERRAAVLAWTRFFLTFQGVVIALAVVWLLVALARHQHGLAWAAPPVGLVLGAGLPLQFAVMAISRASRT